MNFPTKLHVILDDLADENGEVRATNRELAAALGLTGINWDVEVRRSLKRLVMEEQVRRTFDSDTRERVIVLQ